ncbi:hypothetical protein BJY59DRAFT_690933 [Rhodotorula toruloides]
MRLVHALAPTAPFSTLLLVPSCEPFPSFSHPRSAQAALLHCSCMSRWCSKAFARLDTDPPKGRSPREARTSPLLVESGACCCCCFGELKRWRVGGGSCGPDRTTLVRRRVSGQ